MAELQREVERYRDMVESSLGLICTHDLDGVVLWANPAAADLLGWQPEEMIGKNIRQLLAPAVRDEFSAYLERIRRFGEDSGVMQVVTRHGAHRFWKYRNVLRQQAGEPPHVLGHSQDITEQIEVRQALAASQDSLEETVAERTRRLTDEIAQRERAEDLLRRSQRMEAVGVLAGGLAHDFNNLLTAIQGYTELLQKRPDLDSAARRAVEEIEAAGHRAAELTRQLLAFSRQQVMHPKRVEINRAIREAESRLRSDLGEGIDLRLELDPASGHVRIDPSQLLRVLTNLARNARDAMPEGGDLVIRTTPLELEERRDDRPELVPGPYVLVSISDSGLGMDEATRRRAFEPFYTSKNLAEGSGLGLAMVYGIVKQSHGWIYIDSRPGEGTTFDIYLPRIAPGEDAEEAADPASDVAGEESPTILLVEDDPLVARLIRAVLEEAGYDVLLAASGREALEQLRAGPRIALLVSDVVLPGMSGPRLADRVREHQPDVRTLFISGYAPEEVERRGIDEPTSEWLPKPFTPRQLTDRVRRVLQA